MKHLGDITKINGAEIEPVDCITFGAPCQDLSVAGARRGMKHIEHGDGETTRSGLFYEAIRIIKEMRESDKQNGRADLLIRPRYGIYENVPGAFSSNGGRDFQAVLTEFVRVCEPDAPDVPLPDKGKWPKAGALYGVGADGVPFSVAYRLHDAQWWGVPQRRKRLCVLCDFTGYTAAEILFDPQYRRETEDATSDEAVGDPSGGCRSEVPPFTEGLPRYTHPSGETREGTAAGTESCARGTSAISFQERAGKPGGGKGILIQGERTGALSTVNNQSALVRDIAMSVDCRNATEGEVQTSLQAKPNGGFSLNCGAVVRVNT